MDSRRSAQVRLVPLPPACLEPDLVLGDDSAQLGGALRVDDLLRDDIGELLQRLRLSRHGSPLPRGQRPQAPGLPAVSLRSEHLHPAHATQSRT